MPPAFALSQDQTLRFSPGQTAPRGNTPPRHTPAQAEQSPRPRPPRPPPTPANTSGPEDARAKRLSTRLSSLNYTNQRHASDAPRPSHAAKQAQRPTAAPGRARQAGQARPKGATNASLPHRMKLSMNGTAQGGGDPALKPSFPPTIPGEAKEFSETAPRMQELSSPRWTLSRPRPGAGQPPFCAP